VASAIAEITRIMPLVDAAAPRDVLDSILQVQNQLR
jgi:hypothetical protein